MLKKAIYFCCLQLIASPISAGSNGPADIQSSIASYKEASTHTAKDGYKSPGMQQPILIKVPETQMHAWLHNPIDSLTERTIIPTSTWSSIPKIDKLTVDKPKTIELGYISAEKLRRRCAMIHTGKNSLENDIRYAVNYDGNNLIYFGFSLESTLQEVSSQQTSLPLKRMGTYLLSSADDIHSKSQQSLDDLRPCILDHVMFHHKMLVQANHFSMKDNHIVLDNKS